MTITQQKMWWDHRLIWQERLNFIFWTKKKKRMFSLLRRENLSIQERIQLDHTKRIPIPDGVKDNIAYTLTLISKEAHELAGNLHFDIMTKKLWKWSRNILQNMPKVTIIMTFISQAMNCRVTWVLSLNLITTVYHNFLYNGLVIKIKKSS